MWRNSSYESADPWSLIEKEGTNMSTLPVYLSRGLGIVLGLVVATMAHGQQIVVSTAQQEKAPPTRAADTTPGSVHRMVIQEGPNRQVRYFATGNLSASDRLATYDLERAENELSYLRDLQRLKNQYVQSERTMEPQRRIVQQQLYGKRTHYGSSNTSYVNYGSYGYGIYGGYGYPGVTGYNVGYPFWHAGYAGYGGYGGYGYPGGAMGSVGTNSYSEDRSLQYGIGDEGRMKTALVQSVARDATPENAAAALRNYEAAVERAATSPVLSRDLGLKKSSNAAPSQAPTYTKGSKVTIWVGNDKYVGTVKDDRPDWVIIQTDKAEATVRKSEITRSETPSKP
jgi:hypothetical protein